MSELFAAGAGAQPLAARMAPRSLDEFAGQAALLGPGKLLRRLVESGKFASALFFGPPGCGKTALARHIAEKSNAEVVELNAVTAGVADIRKAVEQARYSSTSLGRRTLLLVALSFAADLDKERSAHDMTKRMLENSAERLSQSLRESLEAGAPADGA